jgi:DNA-binding response OmpR family regulator
LRINKTPSTVAFSEGSIPDNSASPRILICEDDADVAHLLSIMLQQIGYASDIAHDAQQAKLRLRERPYFAMTLDIMLPGQDGISLIRELRLDPDLHHLPIVVVSAKSELGQTELSGDMLAVVDWLSKPIDPLRLQAAINHAYRRSKTHRPSILYIEDDADIVRVVSTLLQDKVELLRAQNLAEARELLSNFGPEIDLVILDIGLPDGSGLDLLPELRRPDGTPLQVIVFSAYELDEDMAKRVAMSLVKSRASNQTLLDAINALLDPGYRGMG